LQRAGLLDQRLCLVEAATEQERVREQRHRDAHQRRVIDIESPLVGQHLAQDDRGVAWPVAAHQCVSVKPWVDAAPRVSPGAARRRSPHGQ
jgi:hypothetical protein